MLINYKDLIDKYHDKYVECRDIKYRKMMRQLCRWQFWESNQGLEWWQ